MGTISSIGKGITSLFTEIERQKREDKTSLAQAEELYKRAILAAAQAQAQNGYLLQTTAEKARAVYQNYLQQRANTQTQTASAGLRGDSVTVQYMLKNSRFQALLEQQRLSNALQGEVAATNEQAAQQVRALQQAANEKRRAADKDTPWSLGSWFKWFGGF